MSSPEIKVELDNETIWERVTSEALRRYFSVQEDEINAIRYDELMRHVTDVMGENAVAKYLNSYYEGNPMDLKTQDGRQIRVLADWKSDSPVVVPESDSEDVFVFVQIDDCRECPTCTIFGHTNLKLARDVGNWCGEG